VDLVRTAALVNAGAVIIVHNHPSRKAEPSANDIEATRNVKETFDNLGIELLDHVIITHNNSYSMKANQDLHFE